MAGSLGNSFCLELFLKKALKFFLLVPMLSMTSKRRQITERPHAGNGVYENETELD
jgi:hypothetical protein